MRTKLIAILILLLAVIITNSCENKRGAIPIVVVPCGDTNQVTYSSGANTMQAIINLECATNNTSCHSPGSISTYDYSTWYGIYANYQNGSLYLALFGNGSVPPMPLIPQAGWSDSSACMLDKFKAWINEGCPQ